MNLRDILQKQYPAGSYGGECALWAEKIMSFGPVGNSYSQKKSYVDRNGIIAANIAEVGRGYRVGDVVVTSEGTFMGLGNGHVAIILDPVKMTVVEANFHKDGKVNYGRIVPVNKIYGIIRAPFKINLGQCELNYAVFFNNQPNWNLQFLDELSSQILTWTNNKLKVNFFPLKTEVKNWWYEDVMFPLDGQFYKVIANSYFNQSVMPLSFTSGNAPADIVALIVNPREWQGAVLGKKASGLLGWTTNSNPAHIQISCAESDMDDYYPGMRLITHALVHELSHYLHYVNGLNDTTDVVDLQNRKLEDIFKDLDFNRVTTNL